MLHSRFFTKKRNMDFPNKTAAYLYKTSYIVFFLGAPNFWIEELKGSQLFYKFYRIISRCMNTIIVGCILFELGAFITQKNLTKKQESDLLIYGISHPILWSYGLILWSHEQDIKVLFSHVLRLKSIYNDTKVEERMLKKAKLDSAALALSCIMAVVLHAASALTQYIKSEGTFTTVITTWPLVDDPSHGAHIARVVSYILWWVFLTRVIGSYIIIITLVTSMSHQYMNLQSYFYSIEAIFKDTNLEQSEKETKYEQSLKLGIQLHSETIECVDKFRNICKGIFSVQIVFVLLMLVILMTQMMKSERTVVNAAATAITAAAVLIGTGFFYWNAGDITVEASKLPTAIYSSGWHNCQNTSYGNRKLVVIAMTHAQKPVVIKALGMMTLSYGFYLSLVKTSYSVFSVIY